MSVHNKKQITIFGGIHIDRIGNASSRISADTSTPGTISTRLGGVATNVARVLSSLGHQVTICGVLGNDSDGEQIIKWLKELGIDYTNIFRREGLPTSSYLALQNPDGSLVSAISDSRLTETFCTDDINWDVPEIKQSEMWFIDTNLNTKLIEEISNKSDHQLLAADTVSIIKSVKLIPILKQLNFLFTNLSEASSLQNIKFKNAKLAATSLVKSGAKLAMVTNGAKHAALSYINQENQIEVITKNPPSINIHNVTGAGDIAIGMVLHGLLNEWSKEYTIEMATIASSHAISSKKLLIENFIEEMLENQFRES